MLAIETHNKADQAGGNAEKKVNYVISSVSLITIPPLLVLYGSMLTVPREIHPLDPQPHRYCMLASTASAPRVTRCSLGLYWSRDLCSKHALAGWGMSSFLGQIVRGSEI